MSTLAELIDFVSNLSKSLSDNYELRCSITVYRKLRRLSTTELNSMFGVNLVVDSSYSPDRWQLRKNDEAIREYIPNTMLNDGTGFIIDHTKFPDYLKPEDRL